MPSPLNRPLPAFASAVTIGTDVEHVAVTSPVVIVDTPQYVVVLHGLIDITIGTAGAAITLMLERGTAAAGTPVTSGGTWGPYAVTATDEYQFVVMGLDEPGQAFGSQYVLTVTVGSASGDSTVNAAYLEAIVQART